MCHLLKYIEEIDCSIRLCALLKSGINRVISHSFTDSLTRSLAHSHLCSAFHVNLLMWAHVAHSQYSPPPFILLSIEAIVCLVICVSLFTRILFIRSLAHSVVVWFLAVFVVVNMLRLVISWIFAFMASMAVATIICVYVLKVSFRFSANGKYGIGVIKILQQETKKVRIHFMIWTEISISNPNAIMYQLDFPAIILRIHSLNSLSRSLSTSLSAWILNGIFCRTKQYSVYYYFMEMPHTDNVATQFLIVSSISKQRFANYFSNVYLEFSHMQPNQTKPINCITFICL